MPCSVQTGIAAARNVRVSPAEASGSAVGRRHSTGTTDACELHRPAGRGASGTRAVSTSGLVVLAACVGFSRLVTAIPWALYDDAFITLRYATNLAAGHGFVYNPGAPWEPVLGTTTPAFTLILAGAALLGANLPVFVVVFNAACDAVLAAALVRWIAPTRLAGVLIVGGLACLPPLVRISVGGMESPLFVLAALLTIWSAARQRAVAAGALAVFTTAVRPEGVLLVPLLWLTGLSGGPTARRAAWRFVIAASVLGGLYAAALTAYFGSPIPQSVAAKAADQAWRTQRTLLILGESFVPLRAMVVTLPAAIVGIFLTVRRGGIGARFSAWTLAITAGYLAAQAKTWGWYYYPILVANVVWIATGLAQAVALLDAKLRSRQWRRWRWEPLAAVGYVTACAIIAVRAGPSAVRTNLFGALSHWAAQAHPTPSTTLLAEDIGAIGYYAAPARILDPARLVWPIPPGDDALTLAVRHQPDYVLLVAVQANIARAQSDRCFVEMYTPLQRINAAGASADFPRPEDCPRRWRQDYVLYGRRTGL